MVSKTDRKICGTCEYWTGCRAPMFDKKGVPKVSILDEVGICNNFTSSFADQPRKKELKCKNYSKWPELL